MSRGFTGRTRGQVHDIKRKNGIRRQEFKEAWRTAHWVCQDPANTQRRDVVGSEADAVCSGRITLGVMELLGDQYIGCIKGDQYILFFRP